MSKEAPKTSGELWKRLQRIAVAAHRNPGSKSCNDYDAHAVSLIERFVAGSGESDRTRLGELEAQNAALGDELKRTQSDRMFLGSVTR